MTLNNDNVKDIDARVEEMLVHQILEEHMEKDKKHFQPCTECIRLGINKGYKHYQEECPK